MCPATFQNAAAGYPVCASVNVSSPKVEYVVKPPRTPTKTNARSAPVMWIRPDARNPASRPITAHPITLTPSVA